MIRAKRIDYNPGARPATWNYPLSQVSKFRIESSANSHSSELTFELGDYGSVPVELWGAVRVYDTQHNQMLFYGRIDDIKPIYSPTVGRAYRVHARDYIHTLTDNLVGHKMDHPNLGYFIPNFRMWCEEAEPTEDCGELRLIIFAFLATAVKWGFVSGIDLPPWCTAPGAQSAGDILAPNYLDYPDMSIFNALVELAEGHPWDKDYPLTGGIGYTFRQHFDKNPPTLDYFKKGASKWDSARWFQWRQHGWPYVTVIESDAEREGSSIYSRAIAHGRGDLMPGYSEEWYAGASRSWGGSVHPAYADIELAGMDDTWNPPSSYMVQREAFAHDESINDPEELTTLAVAQLRTTSGQQYRGATAVTFAVPGIPRNAWGHPPLPGDVINVNIPGLTAGEYPIDKWVYSEPEGISYYTVGRRPQADVVAQILADRRRRHQGMAATKACWTTHWWATAPGDHHYWFSHNLGVVPRKVVVEIAAHTGTNDSHSLAYSEISDKSAANAPNLYPDTVKGYWVGFNLSGLTKDRVGIHWADWLGFSEGKADYAPSSNGWLQLGHNAAFRIGLEP